MAKYPHCELPAAKCNGVDLLPAVSLALTLELSTMALTRITSPDLQASKSSRRGSLGLILRGSDDLDIFTILNDNYEQKFTSIHFCLCYLLRVTELLIPLLLTLAIQ